MNSYQVEINCSWYNVDLTWDARNNTNRYCLKDDRTFAKTHKPLHTGRKKVEKCVATGVAVET